MSKELKELLQRIADEATTQLYSDLVALRDIANYAFNERHTLREVREHIRDIVVED